MVKAADVHSTCQLSKEANSRRSKVKGGDKKDLSYARCKSLPDDTSKERNGECLKRYYARYFGARMDGEA